MVKDKNGQFIFKSGKNADERSFFLEPFNEVQFRWARVAAKVSWGTMRGTVRDAVRGTVRIFTWRWSLMLLLRQALLLGVQHPWPYPWVVTCPWGVTYPCPSS